MHDSQFLIIVFLMLALIASVVVFAVFVFRLTKVLEVFVNKYNPGQTRTNSVQQQMITPESNKSPAIQKTVPLPDPSQVADLVNPPRPAGGFGSANEEEKSD